MPEDGPICWVDDGTEPELSAIDKLEILHGIHRNLPASMIEQLQGPRGNYVQRLENIRTSRNGSPRSDSYIGGTGVGRPSYLVFNKKGRTEQFITEPGTVIGPSTIEIDTGHIVIFPGHAIGINQNGTPIFDMSIDGSYTMVHLPNENISKLGTMGDTIYNPYQMSADLIFCVDKFDHVTVNGTDTATVDEYELFDGLVKEFERRMSLSK